MGIKSELFSKKEEEELKGISQLLNLNFKILKIKINLNFNFFSFISDLSFNEIRTWIIQHKL